MSLKKPEEYQSPMITHLMVKGGKARGYTKDAYYLAALLLCGVGWNGHTIKLGSERLNAHDPSEMPHEHYTHNGREWFELKGGTVIRRGWITKKFRVLENKVSQSGRVLGVTDDGRQKILPFGNRGHSHPFETAYCNYRWGLYTGIG